MLGGSKVEQRHMDMMFRKLTFPFSTDSRLKSGSILSNRPVVPLIMLTTDVQTEMNGWMVG
jgi:hypothetical protein